MSSMGRRGFGKILLFGSLLLGVAKFILDSIGRFHDAKWLSEKAGPMMDFLAERPDVWFYGALAVLGLIGLSLHIPIRAWKAAGRVLHLDPTESALADFTKILPGASFSLLTRLSTQGVVRRKYFFSYPAHNDAEVSMFITADNRLIYCAKDEYGEQHSVGIEIDASNISYNEWITVYAALGIAPSYSVMSIWLDGVCRASQRFNFPIRLGEVDFGRGVIGASGDQDRHGRLAIANFVAIERTLSEDEIEQMTQYSDRKKQGKQ